MFGQRPSRSGMPPLPTLVGTARCAVRAAFSGATPIALTPCRSLVPTALTPAQTSQRDVPNTLNLPRRRFLIAYEREL
jgi:hypothetical protein